MGQTDGELGRHLSPAIPWSGVRHVLSGWSGSGQLLTALATVEDESVERRWSTSDVRRRAHRNLFERLRPTLRSWPETEREWVRALPATSTRHTEQALAPDPGTNWVRTRVRGGWPPRAFVTDARHNEANTVLLSLLRWTLDDLKDVYADAASVEPTLTAPVANRLERALGLRRRPPVSEASPDAPTTQTLRAVRLEGPPWNSLAATAFELRRARTLDLETLARELVAPDDTLAWRLFHLAVLGEILIGALAAGATIRSVRPLTASTPGPAYYLDDRFGRRWELWFEAGGVWTHHHRHSPYLALSGDSAAGSPLSADLLLLRPSHSAVALECKYSPHLTAVTRTGFAQAAAYALEFRTALARDVRAIVVGPADVVSQPRTVRTHSGPITLADPATAAAGVQAVLSTRTRHD